MTGRCCLVEQINCTNDRPITVIQRAKIPTLHNFNLPIEAFSSIDAQRFEEIPFRNSLQI